MWTKTLATNALAVLLLAAASTVGAQETGMAYATDGTLFYGGSWHHYRNAQAQPTQIYRLDPPSGLSASAQPGSSAEVVIWSGNLRISDLSLSADGQMLAFREHRMDENVKPAAANYTTRVNGARGEQIAYYLEDSVLKVINRTGVEQLSIPRVRGYSWSRAGQKIAYLTGDYYEGAQGFASTGTWMIDMNSFSSGPTKIHTSGYDVAWAYAGNNVFIWDLTATGAKAFVYRPNTSSTSATGRKGIHFSPSGTYYYRPGYEGKDLGLYLRVGNVDLTADLGWFAAANLRDAQPRGWLSDTLLIVPDGDEDLLIDVAEGYAMKTNGRVLAQGATKESVVILGSQGSVDSVSMKTLQRVYPIHPED